MSLIPDFLPLSLSLSLSSIPSIATSLLYMMSFEKNELSSTTDNISSSQSPYIDHHQNETSKSSLFQSFKDSFKRLEVEVDESEFTPEMTEVERQAVILKNTPLSKSLKNRHLQMIAIGSSVGTGLFVGSGSALRTGGAASMAICWSVVGILLFCVVHALGELQVAFPAAGAFSAHATRFIDPSWGFAVGWNYVMLWLVVLPLEVIAASLTIQYWNSDINPVAWVSIFYVIIICINLFGVRGYGEAEYLFSIVKVVAILGFLILGIVLICGGGPSGGFVGGKNFRDPGPFTNGFKGVASVFVTATYSVGGAEMIAISGFESKNARKTLPSAIKQVFWRIVLFYVGALTLVSLLVNAKDERLLSTSSVDASASPFVLAIKNGGIKGLPSVMNCVILISVMSVGNSAVYGCSRTLHSLATQGLAPSIFAYVDRMGRPIFGILANAISGLLCYTVASDKQTEVFTWLMSICGLAVIFTWLSVSLCHIRLRLAMRAQGRTLDELPFVAHSGFYGSIFAVILLIVFLGLQFWIALFPVGGKPNAQYFFQSYLGGVVFLAFYLGRKIWVRKINEMVPLNQINLDYGRSHSDIDFLKQELAEEKAEMAAKPFWYRTYKFWC